MSSRSARPAEGTVEWHDGPSKADAKPRRARRVRIGEILRHPLAIAAVSALVAGWLFPAFAHQWQDRQKERDLKRELATELDRQVTETVVAAQLLMTRAFPEAQAADLRRAEYEKALPTDRSARASYLDALERERAAGTEAFVRVLSDWLVTRSVTRSALATHFAEEDVANDWLQYANHVTDYVTLASARPGAEQARAGAVDDLSEYLRGEEQGGWRLLERSPRLVEPRALRDYAEAAGLLANTLLVRKNDVVEELLQSHAAGFSTRPRDLLDDLLPFVG
jgi:hypothetical protein